MADTSLVFNILAKDKTGKAFDSMKGKAAAAGAAVGVALAAGAMQTLEQSKITGTLAAQLGASQPQAAALGKMAGQVYAAGFGEDMTQVATAIKSAAQNGFVSMEQIGTAASKNTIQQLLQVSTVVGEESNRVSAAVSTMLRTGMAKNAQEAFDIITKATQNGVNKSEDLIDTIEEYSTLFRSLGLSGPQSMGLLSQAIAGGARNADQAADALKEFSIRAIDGSKTTAAGFKALGMDADKAARAMARGGDYANETLDITLANLRKMKDPIKQNTAGVQLFGTKWEDMRDALLAMDPSTAAKKMDGLAGATTRAGKAMETPGQRVDKLKRSIQQGLVDSLAKAAPKIEATFGWLQRNSSWVVPLTAGLVALAGVIYTITTAMKIWSAVQVVLNLALWTSPITWIVLGIVALVAVIVLIATKTTWFQTAWKVSWNAVVAAFKFVVNWIVSGWKWAIGLVVAGVQKWWSIFTGFWGWVGRTAKSTWNTITNAGMSAVRWFLSMPGRIRGALSNVFSPLWTGFKSAINRIIGGWNNLSFHIGGGSFMGMSIPGFTINTPNLPYLAKGGTIDRAGAAIVGERGPELVHLSRGAQVTPLTGGGGGRFSRMIIEIRSGGSQLDDMLVEILRRAIKSRGGNVQVVLGKG